MDSAAIGAVNSIPSVINVELNSKDLPATAVVDSLQRISGIRLGVFHGSVLVALENFKHSVLIAMVNSTYSVAIITVTSTNSVGH